MKRKHIRLLALFLAASIAAPSLSVSATVSGGNMILPTEEMEIVSEEELKSKALQEDSDTLAEGVVVESVTEEKEFQTLTSEETQSVEVVIEEKEADTILQISGNTVLTEETAFIPYSETEEEINPITTEVVEKYYLDTDGIGVDDIGATYIIAYKLSASEYRILYCADVRTDIFNNAPVNANEMKISSSFAPETQTWRIVQASDGSLKLQSAYTTGGIRYLDLTRPGLDSGHVHTPITASVEEAPSVEFVSTNTPGLYQVKGMTEPAHWLRNDYDNSNKNKWFSSTEGGSELYFYKKQLVKISKLGSGISDMFSSSGSENTWVFTGGKEVEGGFDQVRGARNWIGHYEEYIRWTHGGAQTTGRQRYVVNTGTEGLGIKDVVKSWDLLVAANKPRAVSFFLGEADYAKGRDGLAEFETRLKQFIDMSLALKNGTGYAVIQLPFSTGNDSKDENIKLYSDKVYEIINKESNEYVLSADKYHHIVVVDHFTKTQAISGWSDTYLSEGILNDKGHLEIGRQLAEETIKQTGNFPNDQYNSYFQSAEYARPTEFLADAPKVTWGEDYLQVELSQSIIDEYGDNYHYLVTLEKGDKKTEVSNTVKVVNRSFVIEGLEKESTWFLQLRTGNQRVQLKSTEGTLGDNNSSKAREHQPAAFSNMATDAQKKLAKKLKSKEPVRWLFVGDSITHASKFTKGYDGIAQLFEKYVKGNLNRKDDVIINTAVAGATTNHTLNQAEARLGWQADVVFIMLGTNDAATSENISVEQYVTNLKNIVTTIEEKNPGAIIVFRTPVYTASADRATALINVVEAMVAEGAKTSSDNESLADFIIDQYTPSALALKDLGWLDDNGLLYGDTIHPNELGQILMFRQLIQELGIWNNDTPMAHLLYDTVKSLKVKDSTDITSALTINEQERSLTLNVSSLSNFNNLASATLTVTNQRTGQSWSSTLNRLVKVDSSLANEADRVKVSWPTSPQITLTGLPWNEGYDIEVKGWAKNGARELVMEKSMLLGESSTVTIELNGNKSSKIKDLAIEAETVVGTLGVSQTSPVGNYTFTIDGAVTGKGKSVRDYFDLITEGSTTKLIVKETLDLNETYFVTVKAEDGEKVGTAGFTLLTKVATSPWTKPEVGTNLIMDTKDVRYLIYDVVYEDNDGNPVKLSDTPYTRMLYDSGDGLKYSNDWHTTFNPKYQWKMTATQEEAGYEMRSQRSVKEPAGQLSFGWPLYRPYDETGYGNESYVIAKTRRIESGANASNMQAPLASINFRVMGKATLNLAGEKKDVLYVALLAEGAGIHEDKIMYLSTEDGSFQGTGVSQRTYAHWVEVPENGQIPKEKGWWVLEEAPEIIEQEGDIAGRKLLYRSSAMEYHYRIPAITVTNEGNVIVATDYRFHSSKDVGTDWTDWDGEAYRTYQYGHHIDLHTRISKDNGENWEEAINQTLDYSWAPDFTNKVYANGYGDPALVSDRDTDKVLMVSVSGYKGYKSNGIEASYMLSKDGGETFEAPVNISNGIYKHVTEEKNMDLTQFFFASGRIHQSRYVKVGEHYRLYAAILANYNLTDIRNGNYVLYSDDFGKTWKVLGETRAIPGGNNAGDEAKIEELPNGDVIISSRITKGRKFNIFSYSDTNYSTGTWGTTVEVNLAPGSNSGCNGEVYVVYARNQEGEYGYVMLQSLPATGYRTSVRLMYRWLDPNDEKITIEELADLSQWKYGNNGFLLQNDSSGYSVMALQEDGKIGVAWEEDTAYYNIVYKSFSLDEITNGEFSVAFPSGGIGSAKSPYKVTTKEELEAVKNVYNKEMVYWSLEGEAADNQSTVVVAPNVGEIFLEADPKAGEALQITPPSVELLTEDAKILEEGWQICFDDEWQEFDISTLIEEVHLGARVRYYARSGGAAGTMAATGYSNEIILVGPKQIWVKGVKDFEYNGSKITQDFQVYDGGKLLTENVDYTVSYKNNLNAYEYEEEDYQEFEKLLVSNKKLKEHQTFNSKKAPTIVLKMKGNYSGTHQIYFRILPLDFQDEDIVKIDDISATYTGKKQTPVPVAIWNGKTLKNNKDYVVLEYRQEAKNKNAFKGEAGVETDYSLTIEGLGNFKNKQTITYTISESKDVTSMSKVSVKGVKTLSWTGEDVEQEVFTVTGNKETLQEGIDYTVTYEENQDVGTGWLILTGTEMDQDKDGKTYIGTKRIGFKIQGTSLSKVKVENLLKSYPYTSEEIRPTEILEDDNPVTLTYQADKNSELITLQEGRDYTVSYEKNVNKGTATIIFSGMASGGYSGVKKASFKIDPFAITLDNQLFEVILLNAEAGDGTGNNPYTYQFVKGGVKPEIIVLDTVNSRELIEGVDFTVKYKNNKNIAKVTDKKAPVLEIKGKGNYADTVVQNFEIIPREILPGDDSIRLAVSDKAESTKVGGWKNSFKLYDADGKKLSAQDYDKTSLKYTVVDIPSGVSNLQVGEVITPNDVVPANTVIQISVDLAGSFYSGSVSGTYRILKNGYDISKATIKIKPQEYTGSQVVIDENGDFVTAVLKNKNLYLTDEGTNEANIEIVSFENNVNKGTAKVIFKGKEGTDFGGQKTVTFKIGQRSIIGRLTDLFTDWFWF